VAGGFAAAPGVITLTARRPGLAPATLHLETKPVKLRDGLLEQTPSTYAVTVGTASGH